MNKSEYGTNVTQNGYPCNIRISRNELRVHKSIPNMTIIYTSKLLRKQTHKAPTTTATATTKTQPH